MGLEEQVDGGVEAMGVSDDVLGRLTVDVPVSWSAPPPTGRNRVVFADVDAHVGDGFLPNVALRLDPAGEDDDLPPGNLVLSDRIVEGLGGTRQVRMLVSELPGQLLVQQVTTFRVGDAAATVVASATQSQWPALADVFDAVSASASIEAVEA